MINSLLSLSMALAIFSMAESHTLSCPNNARAAGQCIKGQCSTGYSCQTSSNLCCPVTNQTRNIVCPDGSQPAGACIDGLCGGGYSCKNNLCCCGSSNTTLRCLDGSTPLGTCHNGVCPLNYQCSIGNICCPTSNKCCPTCNNTAGLSGVGVTCPAGTTRLGPTVNGLCAPGTTIVGDNCCLPS